MATARDAVKAAAPAAEIKIECVSVYPIKVTVVAVKPDGSKVCFESICSPLHHPLKFCDAHTVFAERERERERERRKREGGKEGGKHKERKE
jgi:hypothetical protein